MSGDRTPDGVELRVCQCKASKSRQSSTTNSSDKQQLVVKHNRGNRPTGIRSMHKRSKLHGASFEQTTRISNQTSSIKFRTSIKNKPSIKSNSKHRSIQRDANKPQSRRQTNNQHFKSNIVQGNQMSIKSNLKRKIQQKESKNKTRCKQATKQGSNK